MRLHHALLRGGVIIVLASLTIACNAILGVEDVSPICQVNSDITLVVPDAQASLSTFQEKSGLKVPELVLRLDANAKLTIEPYGQTSGTYKLTADDAQYESCMICVFINASSDMATGSALQSFWALGQGELTLTRADNIGLAGMMRDLKFRQVTRTDADFTEVNNGCTVTIHEVQFDMLYVVPVVP
jgi:hypothetical protein